MSLISWNCRGVGGPRTVRALCDVIRSYRPSILGLIETKKAAGDWDRLRVRLGFKGCLAVDSRGRSGGLALLWTDDVELELISQSKHHIEVKVKGVVEFDFTLFYGSPRLQDRACSWDLLRRLKRDVRRPWVVMGDFNEIAYSWEMVSRRDRQMGQMRRFRECLDDCGLTDLGYVGETFTFTNKRKDDKEVKARLDRAVANKAWRDLFNKAIVKHGFANSSDHIPVVLMLKGGSNTGHRSFQRFESMWVRHADFKNVVRRSWSSQGNETPISEKLHKCMHDLCKWGSDTFGNVKRKIKELKDRISQVRKGVRTEETATREASLMEELDEWMEREELWWRQRSRAEWLKHGDRNTSYFHARASHRRRRNRIDSIRNQAGDLCESSQQIETIIMSYFRDIFTSQVEVSGDRWRREFEMIPRMVTQEMNDMLDAPFTEGEVRRALFQMHPTKAPGVDGVSALFYQNNWEVVGKDVVKEVLNCLNEGRLSEELNETLIVLIPKVKKVERVEELRPISLCNVIMKLITKTLANRLKIILPEIISQSQSAFIGGRLITDNILLAHEISHSMRCNDKAKTGSMSLKLDMSKAYDRIEWSFLQKMMLSLGFSASWVRRVMLCVKTVTYKIRINDIVSDVIRPGRGLRQGDPISPYLFLICAEWLTHAINMHQELGLIEGIRVSRGGPRITHLMFADDCLILLKARQDSVKWIREVLRRYEAVSGQKVNYTKSEGVCSRNVHGNFMQHVKDRLGIKMVEAHSNYLGLPMVFGNRKVSLFKTIEEKIMRRIDDWKHKLLSGAGRETLIKAVLQAIPLYAMSCFKVPLTVCKKITSYILKFWWHSQKTRGIYWLKAADLYKEKGLGGIGFRDLKQMNMALLAKQGWRLMTKPDLLVSKVFKARYFPNSELINASKGFRPSYAWRGIVEAMDLIKMGAEWEEGEGKYRWRCDGSGEFTFKSAYLMARKLEEQMDAHRGGPSEQRQTSRFWKSFWRLKIPNKIKIFGWRLFHDALPTMQNLARRGCNVINVCWHCGRSGESSLHLFRDCWWIRGLLQDVNLPKGVWENQCGDSGYWIWLCAKLCSQEEFMSLLGGLWLGWKSRNDKVHGQQGGDILFLRLRLKCIIREWKEGIQPLNWWEELSSQGGIIQ
ncbi:unnamed protein product [Rhodiola kirilowii]